MQNVRRADGVFRRMPPGSAFLRRENKKHPVLKFVFFQAFFTARGCCAVPEQEETCRECRGTDIEHALMAHRHQNMSGAPG